MLLHLVLAAKKKLFCDCKVVCNGLLVNVLRAWRIRLHVTEVNSLEILSAQHSRVFCPEWPRLSRTKKIQICKERPLLCERPGEKSVMWFWRWKAGWKELASVVLKQAWWVLTWFSSHLRLTAWFVWFSKIFQIPSVQFTALRWHICLYTNKRSTVIIRVCPCLHKVRKLSQHSDELRIINRAWHNRFIINPFIQWMCFACCVWPLLFRGN